ncbi:MAG: hypothetical protein MCSN_5360 [Candidatus Microsyncoccus archaeolyticus]|nr:MAG: hypothetical protein MCSN_5360 [Candidatus Parcubacteria bacterium]
MEQEDKKAFFWRTYEKLPEDLKEAIFSETNNEAVKTICAHFNLNEDQTSLVAKYVGRSLMGLLPLKDLPITLELELNMSEEIISKIVRELNYAIFKHLRVSLTKIYSGEEYIPSAPEKKEDAKIKKDDIIKKEKKTEEKKPLKYEDIDPYREQL